MEQGGEPRGTSDGTGCVHDTSQFTLTCCIRPVGTRAASDVRCCEFRIPPILIKVNADPRSQRLS